MCRTKKLNIRFHKGSWKQTSFVRTGMCALIPSILLLALHIDNVAQSQLKLNFTVRWIGHNATETAEEKRRIIS